MVNYVPIREHKPDSGSSIHPSRLKSFVNKKISTLQGVVAMQGHRTEGKGSGQPAQDSALQKPSSLAWVGNPIPPTLVSPVSELKSILSMLNILLFIRRLDA